MFVTQQLQALKLYLGITFFTQLKYSNNNYNARKYVEV